VCGIIGVLVNSKKAVPIIKNSLKQLEYRGYDSVGVATICDGNLYLKKDKGKIDDVDLRLNLNELPGHIGIGHTRWATHGPPSKHNAHPHTDCLKQVVVVHNGIIENFTELKEYLLKRGHKFASETDTEVIPHLIEEGLKKGLSFKDAVKQAVSKLKGSFAIAAIYVKEPDKIICVRNESPLVIGVGDNAVFCASDIPAFLSLTNKVILLYDNELAVLRLDGVEIEDLKKNIKISREPLKINWTPDMAKKGGFPHFMLKEIHEQPRSLRDTLRIREELFEEVANLVLNADNVFMTAAGTSNHACIAGSYMLFNIAQLVAHPIISSEFIDTVEKVVNEKSLIISISQSGETADTLEAVKECKSKGAKVIAITNTLGSSITRVADKIIYTQAGPEIGVAATKTFLVQLATLACLSLTSGKLTGAISEAEYRKLRDNLLVLPNVVEKIIDEKEEDVKEITREYLYANNFFFLGRGINTATAMEGALKLKEIAYIHAEGYPAGESKHGPIALVEDKFPTVFISPNDKTRNKIIGNIMEMKARGAKIISIIEEGDKELIDLSDSYIEIPKGIEPYFTPIPYIVPLQIFAYYMAVRKGYDPDKPRNLAKSVTVK